MILQNKKTGNQYRTNKELAEKAMKRYPGVFIVASKAELSDESKEVKDTAVIDAKKKEIEKLDQIPNRTEAQDKKLAKLQKEIAD